jgi:hypothetical protein
MVVGTVHWILGFVLLIGDILPSYVSLLKLTNIWAKNALLQTNFLPYYHIHVFLLLKIFEWVESFIKHGMNIMPQEVAAHLHFLAFLRT